MKYKIIEVPDRTKLNDKKYIVEIVTAEGISFLKSSFKIISAKIDGGEGLKTEPDYTLAYEYTTFDSIEAAKDALNKFITANPIYAEGKRIVEEGTI